MAATSSEALNFDSIWTLLQETGKEFDRRLQESRKELQESRREFDQWLKESRKELQESRKEFDQWLKESRKELQESRKESDKQFQEVRKETERRFQETERQMKETDRRLGELGNRFGELAEHLVAPSIKEKFNALGYTFTKIGKDVKFEGPDGVIAELDILLEDGDYSVAVEIKAKLLQKDIDDHVKRIERLRLKTAWQAKQEKILGAVAGAIVTEEVKAYAHKTGLYVIEQSGDTVKIDIPPGFKPRAW